MLKLVLYETHITELNITLNFLESTWKFEPIFTKAIIK